jgi:hypothetical protein
MAFGSRGILALLLVLAVVEVSQLICMDKHRLLCVSLTVPLLVPFADSKGKAPTRGIFLINRNQISASS